MRQKYALWLYSEINIQFKRTTTIPNTLQQNVHAVITDCALKTQRIMFIHTKNVDWYEKNVVKKTSHKQNCKYPSSLTWMLFFFYSRTYKTISLADGLSISKKNHFFFFYFSSIKFEINLVHIMWSYLFLFYLALIAIIN